MSERLDEETERLIFKLTDAGIAHGYASERVPIDNMHAAENALRSRIRFLIEEARKDGQSEQAAAMADSPDV